MTSNETQPTSPEQSGSEHPNLYSSVPTSHQVLVHASLDAVNSLFPDDLAGAILREPHPTDNTFVAGISMTFPNTFHPTNIECQLTADVSCERASYFVQKLFEVELITRGGLRYLSLLGGVEVVPHPCLTLTQCKSDSIFIFGNVVANAVRQSLGYQEEVKQCRSKTKSVWVVISSNANDPISINLSLGLWLGTRISQKLFPARTS